MDLALATLLAAATSPLAVAIAAAVRFSSPGPVLYGGTRVGRHGRPFVMYKFRTMRADADATGPGLTALGDERITPVGRVLRRTKMDELPQLLNVIRGDMSLVGPRPEAPQYVDHNDEVQRLVLTVRPGITGPTQLRYRHEERLMAGPDFEAIYRKGILPTKLQSDLFYVKNRSLWGDVRLLVDTVRALFAR